MASPLRTIEAVETEIAAVQVEIYAIGRQISESQELDADEKKSLRKEKEQLRTKEEQLRNEKELLLKRESSASGAGDVGPSNMVVNPMERFKQLLRQGNVDRPHAATLSYLTKVFAPRLLIIVGQSDVAGALELYDIGKYSPHTATCESLKPRFIINGPCGFPSESSVLLKCWESKSTKQLVCKIPHHRTSSKEIEYTQLIRDAYFECRDLERPSILVGEIVSVPISSDDARTILRGSGEFKAVMFPFVSGTLAQLPSGCAWDWMFDQYLALRQAMQWLHSIGLVHMDITVNNIFLNADGRWLLGDWGSVVKIGDPVVSYSKQFMPLILDEHINAVPVYDELMLAVAVCVHSVGSKFKEDLMLEQIMRVSPDKLNNFVLTIPHDDLRHSLQSALQHLPH